MSDQVVPLSSAPNQKVAANLNVNGKILKLNLSINFSEMAQLWMMAISDVNNNLLVDSLPMVTGAWPAANILAQYQYLQIGSCYLINNGSPNDVPNNQELGSLFLLVWGDNVTK